MTWNAACYYKTEKGTSRKNPLPFLDEFALVLWRVKIVFIVHFGMEGEVEMAFFLFFSYFLIPWTQRAD